MSHSDSELKDRRQFPARKLVQIVGCATGRAAPTDERECDMKRLIPALIALSVLGSAYADAPAEPPLEPHPVATVVFILLFVGVCVAFMWMIWRKKSDKKEE
jgi:hypothetical protein